MSQRKGELYFRYSAESRVQTARRAASGTFFLVRRKEVGTKLFPDRFLQARVISDIGDGRVSSRFDEPVREPGVLVLIQSDHIKRHRLTISLHTKIVRCFGSEKVRGRCRVRRLLCGA